MKKDYQKEKKLLDEFAKIECHARKNSYKTRKRYAQTMKQFISFLCLFSDSPSQLKGINNFWVVRFILHQQGLSRSPNTLKAQLAHIRYWHSYIPQTKFRLGDNDYLLKIAEETKKEASDELGRSV